MSHFTVTVALPADTTDISEAITRLLKPFDENLDVEEHTDEDGDTYWRNPDAKWDYWVIGGRWRGYFIPADGVEIPDPQSDQDEIEGLPEVLRTEYRSHFSFGLLGRDEADDAKPGRVDGGRIRSLDLKALRERKAREAEEAWNEYAMAIDGTPQHQPWKIFYERVQQSEAAAPKPWKQLCDEAYERARQSHGFTSEEQFDEWLKTVDDDSEKRAQCDAYNVTSRTEMDKARAEWESSQAYPISKARNDYANQPRIKALREHETYQQWFDGPETTFDHLTRDEYVEQQRQRAVPGYATVTHTGQWLAPGRMGWFGMSDDNEDSYLAYVRDANAYIDSLPQDAYLVVLDCHI